MINSCGFIKIIMNKIEKINWWFNWLKNWIIEENSFGKIKKNKKLTRDQWIKRRCKGIQKSWYNDYCGRGISKPEYSSASYHV